MVTKLTSLSNGIILQWVVYNPPSAGLQTIQLPIANTKISCIFRTSGAGTTNATGITLRNVSAIVIGSSISAYMDTNRREEFFIIGF